MSSFVYKRCDTLTYPQVQWILNNVDYSKVSTAAPNRNVANNTVFVYLINTNTKSAYWRRDGYVWINLRAVQRPTTNPIFRRVEHQLLSRGTKVDFFKHEYTFCGNLLKPPNAWKKPFVLLHYFGTFNIALASNALHGNRILSPLKKAAKMLRELTGESTPPLRSSPVKPIKTKQTARKSTGGLHLDRKMTSNDPVINDYNATPIIDFESRPDDLFEQKFHPEPKGNFIANFTLALSNCEIPHQRTSTIVIDTLTNKLQSNKSPTQAFRETRREILLEHGDDNPTMTPRNRKQVYNLQQQIKKENHHDDIYECYLFGNQHPGIVVKLELIPQVLLIQMNPDLTAHARSLQCTMERLVFHYDTTFDVGSFFTSVLTMRHPLFKSEPLIPVAVMFHETTQESSHQMFFRTITEYISINNESTIIVTDKEKSIVNAIKRQLPKAHHFFCWNHIRKNVGEWVRKHLSAKEASSYKQDVLQLLQSTTKESYIEKLNEMRNEWKLPFQNYYEKFIEDSVLQCYRPELETVELYNEISGITNNPAESTNAAFKKILESKNTSFFQAVSSLYFLQVDICLDIFSGMKNEGDFKLAMDVPKGIFTPENIKDVVAKDCISELVKNGKIPTELQTKNIYKSKSLYEATTLRGMASLFVQKNGVSFVQPNGVFVVTGLLNIKYMVDLKNGSCSCKRSSSCEHILAVLMCLGIEHKYSLKRCQPNLGTLYRKTVKKAVGKKKGQGFRVLTKIPLSKNASREKIPMIKASKATDEILKNGVERKMETIQGGQPAYLDPVAVTPAKLDKKIEEKYRIMQETGSVTSVLKTKQPIFPRLSNENLAQTILKLPTGNITLMDFKSVQTSFTMAETRLLRKLLQNEFEKSDWMTDSVIAGFILMITDFQNAGCVSITPLEAANFFMGNDTTLLFSSDQMIGKDYYDWKRISQVHIPLNVNGDHWVLIVLFPAEGDIHVMDPVGSYQLPVEQQYAMQQFFNTKCGYHSGKQWKITYPETVLSIGEKAMQCGPFICFYSEATAKGWPLSEIPNVDHYRSHILATLAGNCLGGDIKRNKKCYGCEKLVSGNEKCNFCDRKVHSNCMKSVVLRGRVYKICYDIIC